MIPEPTRNFLRASMLVPPSARWLERRILAQSRNAASTFARSANGPGQTASRKGITEWLAVVENKSRPPTVCLEQRHEVLRQRGKKRDGFWFVRHVDASQD